uniref:Ig-like domain-containing protein n=2 Tax=Iconisemion striatum TaxID=60296 RepID=A0A1A7X3T8_9TELE
MLRFLFFLLPYTGLPVSACDIMFAPPKVVVRYGDPLVANCISKSCHNVAGMGWESAFGAVGLTKNVSSLPYKIDKVNDWEILSHCYMSFSDDQDQRLITLPVTVYKMPANVSITNPPEHLLEGEKYSLKCIVTDVAPAPNLSVFWLGKKGELKKETFSETSITPLSLPSSLDFTPHRDDHGSEIRCEARLDMFPDGRAPLTMQSQPLILNVHYSPNFPRPENETLKMSANSSMTFDCTAAGNPEPVYNWSFASPTQPATQIQNMNKAILTETFALPGIYSCTASNPRGSKTKHFIVTEAEGSRTTFAAILGGFLCLGAVLFVAGLVFVTPNGRFSFKRKASSAPI